MPTMITFTMAATLALLLGASQADALTSVDLKYMGGATGTANCSNGTSGVPCIHTNIGDIISFAITVDVGTEGLGTFSFDLRWDQDGENELDLGVLRTRGALDLLTSDVPPVTVAFLPLSPLGPIPGGSLTDSTSGNPGLAIQIGAVAPLASPDPGQLRFPGATSFRLGFVKFHVNGNVNKGAGADIEVGFFDTIMPYTNIWEVHQEGVMITPNFGSFAIDSVPEPGTSELMGMGVLGLALASLASRKS